MKKADFIYFFQVGDWVKIGITTDIPKRLSGVQTGCPLEIIVLAIILGDKAKEREIHRQFKHLNTSGEWFYLAPELREYINGLPVVDLTEAAAIRKEYLEDERRKHQERLRQEEEERKRKEQEAAAAALAALPHRTKNRLKVLLAERGMSIRQLANAAGLHYTTVRRFANDEATLIHKDILNTICTTLRVQPGDIFVYLPDQPPQ